MGIVSLLFIVLLLYNSFRYFIILENIFLTIFEKSENQFNISFSVYFILENIGYFILGFCILGYFIISIFHYF